MTFRPRVVRSDEDIVLAKVEALESRQAHRRRVWEQQQQEMVTLLELKDREIANLRSQLREGGN